jgi:hypothetical protein
MISPYHLRMVPGMKVPRASHSLPRGLLLVVCVVIIGSGLDEGYEVGNEGYAPIEFPETCTKLR